MCWPPERLSAPQEGFYSRDLTCSLIPATGFLCLKYKYFRRLGGIVVSVLATGPKGRGFEPGQGDGFLRVIKIRDIPSFGWDVKPEVLCRKILRHVKCLMKSHGDE
jgi:hypothetical protein